MDDRHTMRSGGTSASVLRHGAELCSMMSAAGVSAAGVSAAGREVIWQAGPVWPSHAPILFPIIGELKGGHLTVDGRQYAMRRHGFARARDFEWVARTEDCCTLRLDADEETRAMFPFEFRLELTYALSGETMRVTATVTNTGPIALPCSLGFHPAFNWPLSGTSKAGHRIELSSREEDTIAQLNEAGVVARRVPNPLTDGRVAALSDALFAQDALIFDPLHSTGARFVAPDGTAVHVAWQGATQLGLWSKPGDFVCIEPWIGVASPAEFAGEFSGKPGLMHLAPGHDASLRMTIGL